LHDLPDETIGPERRVVASNVADNYLASRIFAVPTAIAEIRKIMEIG
jgi:hypothetical protein